MTENNKKVRDIKSDLARAHKSIEDCDYDNIKKETFSFITTMTKYLVLYQVGYKCEKCGTTERLTQHHLVSTKSRFYTTAKKYFIARNHFNNQLILCDKCHCEIEHRKLENWKDYDVISNRTIRKVKKLFGDVL
jgi:hypothetical protein